jgi:hypothetical protein
MVTCRESARLLSERRDHPLPPGKRIALRLHLLLCRLCRVYSAQMCCVCGICHEAASRADEKLPDSMPVERKQRIKDAMSKESA